MQVNLSSLEEGKDYIGGEYIVKLKNTAFKSRAEANSFFKTDGIEVKANLGRKTLLINQEYLTAFKKRDDVEIIEPNYIAHTTVSENASSWGLDYIDGRRDGFYTYDQKGNGVHVYVLDTGIRGDHREFTGRIGQGWTAVDNQDPKNDCSEKGHGTHVSATIGGKLYGVAKGVILHPVAVLGCNGSGSFSNIISGINWVKNHVTQNSIKKAVVNMSIGGNRSSILNDAVSDLVKSGITVVVSAGNSSSDACNQSPASAPEVLTVGATTQSNSMASFSNGGSCVDILAPGQSIKAASNASVNGIRTLSGTSMAAPHVAGVAAIILSQNNNYGPKDVEAVLRNSAVKGKISNVSDGTPNLFLLSKVGKESQNPESSDLEVIATYPRDGKTNVSVPSEPKTIGIDFKGNIKKGPAFEEIRVNESQGNGSKVRLNLSFSIKGIRLDSSSYLYKPGRTYRVLVPKNALRDSSGNTNEFPITFSWTMANK
jgi:subtilisin family serine protease